MKYVVKICFKNGMCHAKVFDNESERESLLIVLVDEFLQGSIVGTVVDDCAFRYADVLVITKEDISVEDKGE